MRKREVRIGLAVIFVLLVVLGVVVVRRLSGSREEPQVASLESKSDELEKVPEHPGRKEADPLSHAKKFTLLAPKDLARRRGPVERGLRRGRGEEGCRQPDIQGIAAVIHAQPSAGAGRRDARKVRQRLLAAVGGANVV
jgi:hypothetical protein